MKRGALPANPIAHVDRPPHRQLCPPLAAWRIMHALIEATRQRGRPRDLAVFPLVMRFTGLRRSSVAGLRVRNFDPGWGLRGVPAKGDTTMDVPLPGPVIGFLQMYVECVLTPRRPRVTPETPLFWSTWGRRTVGLTREPMTGKNIWRLCQM